MATSTRREAAQIESAICTASEAVGNFIYFVASGDVRKVDIDAAAFKPAVGIIIQKPTATSCVVQLSGSVSGILSGLTAGDSIFVSLSSTGTQTLPPAGAGLRWRQVAAVAIGSTEFKLEFYSPIGLTP